MTYEKAKSLAKELCSRYGMDTYVHTDPACLFNVRFEEPIETIRPEAMEATCYTVGVATMVNGGAKFEEWPRRYVRRYVCVCGAKVGEHHQRTCPNTRAAFEAKHAG